MAYNATEQFCLLLSNKSRQEAKLSLRSRPYCQKLSGSRDLGHAHFQGKLFVRPFPIQSCIPNLKSLAQVVFEILRSKRIGVTSLTFQGHVTSSVTWPFDSPYAISYWWSFGTKPLSLTVSEIFNVKCNAIIDVTLIRPLNKGQGHSFWYSQ